MRVSSPCSMQTKRLPKFLVKDMPDGRTFKGIAHDTIGKARANGRYANVRWWGEMVNVLYVRGNGQASTRLEEFFDEDSPPGVDSDLLFRVSNG